MMPATADLLLANFRESDVSTDVTDVGVKVEPGHTPLGLKPPHILGVDIRGDLQSGLLHIEVELLNSQHAILFKNIFDSSHPEQGRIKNNSLNGNLFSFDGQGSMDESAFIIGFMTTLGRKIPQIQSGKFLSHFAFKINQLSNQLTKMMRAQRLDDHVKKELKEKKLAELTREQRESVDGAGFDLGPKYAKTEGESVPAQYTALQGKWKLTGMRLDNDAKGHHNLLLAPGRANPSVLRDLPTYYEPVLNLIIAGDTAYLSGYYLSQTTEGVLAGVDDLLIRYSLSYFFNGAEPKLKLNNRTELEPKSRTVLERFPHGDYPQAPIVMPILDSSFRISLKVTEY